MIRRVTLLELDEVVSLVALAVATMNSRGINQWDEVYPTREIFTQDIAGGALWGYYDGTLKGIAVLNEQQDVKYRAVSWKHNPAKVLVVHRLCVNPQNQGKGIAHELMGFAECYAMIQGYGSLRLDAFSENPAALSLYNRLGYSKAGEVRFRKGLFYCFEKQL